MLCSFSIYTLGDLDSMTYYEMLINSEKLFKSI